jgi:hypothetical protein
MTGGIGFSRQGTQSFQDNLNLKNFRQKVSPYPSIKRITEGVDIIGLQESINHRNKRAKSALLQSWIVLLLIFTVVFTCLAALLFG